MSKRTRILFIIATVAIMALVFTGCGLSKEEKALIGRWETTGVKVYSAEMTAEEMKSEQSETGISYFEFKKGGKVYAKLFGVGTSLRWKFDKGSKNTVLIDTGSVKMLATINDDGTMTVRDVEADIEFYLTKK